MTAITNETLNSVGVTVENGNVVVAGVTVENPTQLMEIAEYAGTSLTLEEATKLFWAAKETA